DLFVLEYTGGKLFIPTVSSANSVKLIADAKKKGLQVFCSVAVHNLTITDSELENFDTQFKVMPPLRTSADIKALQKAVKNGTIDLVTTDHTPLNIELKHVEFDNAEFGTIGLESAFGTL
ncbi:MAG TPA: dihydroorotase, partial [Maribacter sp.]|nr:dihydroorotase [Maribacter sp.]